MMNMTFDEAVSYLYSIPKFTKKNDMGHTKRLLEGLHNPENEKKVIHVAGSNGKGSVCSYIYNVLQKAGASVGLFTSPHLVDVRERFQVNGQLVSVEAFMDAFASVYELADDMVAGGDTYPTFFEFIFAMGMLIFDAYNVEFIVLETGLGGRLDATNSIEKPVLTVITSISLEHTEILGNTIEAIAYEKAGIIKMGVPLVYDANDQRTEKVILEIAKQSGAETVGISKINNPVIEINNYGIDFSLFSDYDRGDVYHIVTSALYQVQNASVAITALRVLNKTCNIISDSDIHEGIKATFWPGRMQQIEKDVFFDGAHNVSGIEQFVESVNNILRSDETKPLLLFSMVKEKDYDQAAKLISRGIKWQEIVITSNPSDRSLTPDALMEVFSRYNNCPVKSISRYDDAYRYVMEMKNPGQKVFCTGSLYFIGALMSMLRKREETND